MKVLLLSQRRISRLVAYCLAYEFEDVVAAVTDARRLEVDDWPAVERSRRAYRLARLAAAPRDLARRLARHPIRGTTLDIDYDLFLPVFNNTYELYSIATVANWRQRCRRAACFINEVGSQNIPEYLVELLSDFDHIFLGTLNGLEQIARISCRPCTYLPLATDVVRFAPASLDQPRPIYVSYIGRRSPIAHQALLEAAKLQDMFYYFDTVAASGAQLKDRTFSVDNPAEHRHMLATILKHTDYFIANRSYVNRPDFVAAHDEISARFYEGTAAGTIMVGEAPRTAEFKRQFDWPDSVIHMPFDCPEVGRILDELDRDPERQRAIRGRNVREAALRHDWLHRIQAVFSTLGLDVTCKMRDRSERLRRIASSAVPSPV